MERAARRLTAAAALQALLFLAQIVLAAKLSAAQHAGVNRFPPLPLPILDDSGHYAPPLPVLATAARCVLALAQTLVALAMVRLAERAAPGRGVALSIAAGLAIALGAPVLFTGDVYAYTAYGLLGRDAYAPPAAVLPVPFDVINGYWGVPLPGSVYGPLWTWISVALVSLVRTPLVAVFAFRIAGALALAAAAALAQRRSGALALALAASPYLWWLDVTDAHNDLAGVDFILLAFALAPRSGAAAAFAMAGAMLIKGTLLLPALLAGHLVRGRRARAATAGAALALALMVTALAAGPAFPRVLVAARSTYGFTFGGLHYAFVALALILTLAALAGRVYRGGQWSYPWLGTSVFPWYLNWSLPYAALLSGRAAASFVAVLPLAGVAIDTGIGAPLAVRAIMGALAIALAALAAGPDQGDVRE